MSARRAPAPIPARPAMDAAADGPTVTDADLVCGYLNPDYFLGGTQRLDVAASRAALEAHVAAPLRMDVMAAAAGIQRIVDMRMADEVRVFAAKRGVDLSAFTLLPFGGAGAVHAAAVAEELGMRRILVPPRPGAFSALGLLCTDVVHDYIRSELRPLAEITADHAEDIFRQLERKAGDELAAEGMSRRRCALRARARPALYRPGLRTAHAARRTVRGSADRGVARRGAGQVRRAPRPQSRPRRQGAAGGSGELPPARARGGAQIRAARDRRAAIAASVADAVKGKRAVSFNGPVIEAVLYERDRLDIGATIAGPALVEQFDATTVIPPGWNAHVDGYGNLSWRGR